MFGHSWNIVHVCHLCSDLCEALLFLLVMITMFHQCDVVNTRQMAAVC